MAGERDSLEDLTRIFHLTTKSALAEHCRYAVVSKSDLADLIIACSTVNFPIRHIPVFKHHHPEHLQLNDADLAALGAAKVGPLEGASKKAIRKIGQTFSERRLFCGHMFWPPRIPGHWHLIYFDQRDIGLAQNHWVHGTHLHLMNMVTHPQVDPNDLLQRIWSAKRPKLSGALHIRYADLRPSESIS